LGSSRAHLPPHAFPTRRSSDLMTPEEVLEIGTQAMWIAVLLAAPVLLTALAVGVLIGMVQAATQIQEMTLSFIPKLLGVAAVLADRKSTRLNSSHVKISYAVFC